MNMEHEPECLRCGRCCWYLKGDRFVKCKYLKYNRKHNKTYCAIWSKRKFMLENGENPVIDRFWNHNKKRYDNVICIYRRHMRRNYEGCPYNKPEYDENETNDKGKDKTVSWSEQTKEHPKQKS